MAKHSEARRQEIIAAINDAGTLEKAAEDLGITTMTLWRWIQKYSIETETERRVWTRAK